MYLRAVDSCLACTTSTHGDSPLSRFALIDSPLNELSSDDCLILAEIDGHLMVTFITINRTVMADDTDNEIIYINTNPLNLEQTSTSRAKQEEEDCKPLVIDLVDSPKAKSVEMNWMIWRSRRRRKRRRRKRRRRKRRRSKGWESYRG